MGGDRECTDLFYRVKTAEARVAEAARTLGDFWAGYVQNGAEHLRPPDHQEYALGRVHFDEFDEAIGELKAACRAVVLLAKGTGAQPAPRPEPEQPKCWCWVCFRVERRDPMTRTMILCPTCGNKRCPHATCHEHACTSSNAPDQPGSAYGGFDVEAKAGELLRERGDL